MDKSRQARTAELLAKLRAGDRSVMDELFTLVYDALRSEARQQRNRWHGDYTLNTTALVHEAYIKLVDQTHAGYESQAHFLGVASKAMRHILVDYARRRKSLKRGGDVPKVSLEDMQHVLENQMSLSDEHNQALVVLDEALNRLALRDERAADVVECRLFGGMTITDTAAALDMSPRTVSRDWAMAQAWLLNEIRKDFER